MIAIIKQSSSSTTQLCECFIFLGQVFSGENYCWRAKQIGIWGGPREKFPHCLDGKGWSGNCGYASGDNVQKGVWNIVAV